jgi:hypothetical protein
MFQLLRSRTYQSPTIPTLYYIWMTRSGTKQNALKILMYILNILSLTWAQKGWNSTVGLGFSEKARLRLEVWEWNRLDAMDFVGCTHLDQLYLEARKGKTVDVWRPLTCKGVKTNASVRILFQKGPSPPTEMYFVFPRASLINVPRQSCPSLMFGTRFVF